MRSVLPYDITNELEELGLELVSCSGAEAVRPEPPAQRTAIVTGGLVWPATVRDTGAWLPGLIPGGTTALT